MKKETKREKEEQENLMTLSHATKQWGHKPERELFDDVATHASSTLGFRFCPNIIQSGLDTLHIALPTVPSSTSGFGSGAPKNDGPPSAGLPKCSSQDYHRRIRLLVQFRSDDGELVYGQVQRRVRWC